MKDLRYKSICGCVTKLGERIGRSGIREQTIVLCKKHQKYNKMIRTTKYGSDYLKG